MATNFVTKFQTLPFRRSGIQKRNGITPSICKILMKIGPVVSAENRLTDGNALWFGNFFKYFGYSRLIFAIFSPYKSILRADNGSVPYFPISHGTLPWQPNNVAVVKTNWYYVHFLHVHQMGAQFCLAGAPSRLLARLCHSLLVSYFLTWAKLSQDLLNQFSRFFSPNERYLR